MRFKIAFVIFLILVTAACRKNSIQVYDLLFQKRNCGDFCEAINAVTPDYKGVQVNHVGIVVDFRGKLEVLEANSNGVVLTALDDFLKKAECEATFVGSLSKNIEFKRFTSDDIAYYLGKPYDTVFAIDNNAYYCSELVYLLFQTKDQIPIFELQPMTFKKPGSNEFFGVWKDYFAAMQIDIPENQPGINPGQIINSTKIVVFDLPRRYRSLCM